MTWDKNFLLGTELENFIKDYLFEVFGWEFVACTVNGEVVNKEFIEKTFYCCFLSPRKGRGPKLIFSDGEQVSMPDLLLKSKNNLLFWVESKASNKSDYNSIDIEENKLNEYFIIKEKTNKPVWIIISVVEEDLCMLYAGRIQDLLNGGEKINNLFWGKIVRRYDLSNENIHVLTKYPIKYK